MQHAPRVTVCPATTIDAPIEVVWPLVTDPHSVGDWADVRFEAAEPDGPVHIGQRWHFSTPALGRRWPVTMTVTNVSADCQSLALDVALPLGIRNEEHMTLARLADGRTRVQFG